MLETHLNPLLSASGGETLGAVDCSFSDLYAVVVVLDGVSRMAGLPAVGAAVALRVVFDLASYLTLYMIPFITHADFPLTGGIIT